MSLQARFCLAGGCFKSLIHGRPPNDLDLWPASEEDRLSLIRELTACGAEIEGETPFNTVLIRACDQDFWNFIRRLKGGCETDEAESEGEFEEVDQTMTGMEC